MSNFLAIAAVTATLRNRLEAELLQAGLASTVTIGPPVFPNATVSHTNIFLFQVTPNVALRNSDLPTRRGFETGSAIQKPRVAIDLHYLVSFSGDYTTLAPLRMMGKVVSSLHGNPCLSTDEIQSATQAEQSGLSGSDLANETERIKFTPTALTLDELSKLWSIFLQTTYVPSLVYQASVVVIDADVTPRPAPPVRTPGVYSTSMRGPVVEEVVNADESVISTGERQPITIDSTLALKGVRLGDATAQVRFDTGELAACTIVSDNRLEVKLSTVANLKAGIRTVRAIYPVQLNGTLADHPGVGTESNAVAFIFRPKVKIPSPIQLPNVDQPPVMVAVQLLPAVGKGQTVILLLNSQTKPAVALRAEPRTADGDKATFSLPAIPALPALPVLPAGTYFARISVDGAESVLERYPNGALKGPTVVVSP